MILKELVLVINFNICRAVTRNKMKEWRLFSQRGIKLFSVEGTLLFSRRGYQTLFPGGGDIIFCSKMKDIILYSQDDVNNNESVNSSDE